MGLTVDFESKHLSGSVSKKRSGETVHKMVFIGPKAEEAAKAIARVMYSSTLSPKTYELFEEMLEVLTEEV